MGRIVLILAAWVLSCYDALEFGLKVNSVAPWQRVIAIGDMHGDLAALRTCLRVAGVIDGDGQWSTSESTLVVCCGDLLGKGSEDWTCLKYLHSLRGEAQSRLGNVVMVLGNHEVMNVAGDMRYVTREGFREVAADTVGCSSSLQAARQARTEAFRPGGPGALLLEELCAGAPVARIVGDTLFCHGGLHATFLERHRRPGEKYRRVLRRVNNGASDWLLGHTTRTPDSLTRDAQLSPAWLDAYSNPPDAEPHPTDCLAATRALALLNCNRMIVGHTPQLHAGCNAACRGAVIRIDTGASKSYGGPKEALEL